MDELMKNLIIAKARERAAVAAVKLAEKAMGDARQAMGEARAAVSEAVWLIERAAEQQLAAPEAANDASASAVAA